MTTHESNRISLRALLAVALAATVALSAGVAGVAVAASTTTVTATPADQSLGQGETTTIEFAVQNADGGVAAGDFDVEVSNPEVAAITDLSLGGSPPDTFVTKNIAADGSSASVSYFGATTADSGPVTFVTVTLETAADASGTTDVSLDVTELTDSEGAPYDLTEINTATITIEEPNSPPTADAGDDQTVDEDTQVTLDATGSSDGDGSIASYAWTQTGSGPSVTLSDTSAAQPTFTAPDVDSATDLTFEVTVTDDDGATATDSVTVTVEPTNEAPTIDAVSDQTVTEGDSATVAVSASDPDGDSVSLSLTESPDFVSLSNGEITIEPGDGDASDSPYSVTVEANDGNGGTATESFQVTVQEPAEANFQLSNLDAPTTVTQGDTIDVSADVENTGGQTATKAVEFRVDTDGDGDIADEDALVDQSVELAPGATETVTFADVDTGSLEPGTYTHGVVTADDSATATITVEEPAPTDEVSVSLEPSETSVGVGGQTTLDVVVNGLDGGGVGAFDLTVSAGDTGTVSIVDASVTADSGGDGSTEVILADDGSSAQIRAAVRDTADSSSVTVATVTLSGDAVGDTTADLSVDAIGDESGIDYDVASATGATVEVQPVSVEVSSLDAPGSAAPGDTIDVSAEVTNTGEQTVTRTIEFRLDLNGDGDLTPDETVATETVTVGAGLSAAVTFTATVPEDAALADTAHGVFADTSQTATIRIAPPKLDPQFAGQPIDPDGDGVYEDVNGNGEVNEVDSQALFANLDNPTLDEYGAQFDYNGNGEFNVVDVQFHFKNEIPSATSAGSVAGPAQAVGLLVDTIAGWF